VVADLSSLSTLRLNLDAQRIAIAQVRSGVRTDSDPRDRRISAQTVATSVARR
jgi:hypothetical protein